MNIVKGIKPLSLSPSLRFLKHYVSLQHKEKWIMFYLGTMANGQHACVLYDTTVIQFHGKGMIQG